MIIYLIMVKISSDLWRYPDFHNATDASVFGSVKRRINANILFPFGTFDATVTYCHVDRHASENIFETVLVQFPINKVKKCFCHSSHFAKFL